MPLVIDANAANALAAGSCESSKALIEWVRRGGQVKSGGRLQEELKRTQLRDLLVQWSAAGRLVILPAADVRAREALLSGQCVSNDAHVLAVLILGEANVLVSGDVDLQADAKNRALLGKKCKVINCSQGVFSQVRIVRNLLARYA